MRKAQLVQQAKRNRADVQLCALLKRLPNEGFAPVDVSEAVGPLA